MRIINFILLLTFTLFLNSCGGPFTRLTKPDYADKTNGYSVALPVGWVQMTGPQNEGALWISKDGYSLQSIRIDALKYDKAFEKIKKNAALEMPVSDLAELELAEFKAKNPNSGSVKVLENVLITVSGQKAFRLHLQFLNDKGLRFEHIAYGLISARNYYKLTYQAPKIHYFGRDKATFDSVVNSFKLQS